MKAPLLVKAPRLAIVLLLARSAVLPVLPVSVFKSSTVPGFCVTAPPMLAAEPKFRVPLAAVTLPSATVVAFWIFTAKELALLVVRVESLSWIVLPPPLIVVVPEPALTARPEPTTTPPTAPPVRLKLPEVEASAWATVKPVEPTSVIVPEPVVSVPVVESAPPLLRRSMLPVPVLKLVAAGKVSVVPAIAVIPVFAPSAGTANVRALTSLTETEVPVALRVTAPVKSLPTLSRMTASTMTASALPVMVTAPAPAP